jgi:hypothetical protein
MIQIIEMGQAVSHDKGIVDFIKQAENQKSSRSVVLML